MQWRVCPGFPSYAVSSTGRIIRVLPARNRAAWQEVQPASDPDGYSRVWLCRDGGVFARRVQRLVCEAFHGPPPSRFHEAAHNDGTRSNNAAENLRWATPSENQRDRVRHGTGTAGESNPRAKLTEDDVRIIRLARDSGHSIARDYGVTPGLISQIRRRKIWRDVA